MKVQEVFLANPWGGVTFQQFCYFAEQAVDRLMWNLRTQFHRDLPRRLWCETLPASGEFWGMAVCAEIRSVRKRKGPRVSRRRAQEVTDCSAVSRRRGR